MDGGVCGGGVVGGGVDGGIVGGGTTGGMTGGGVVWFDIVTVMVEVFVFPPVSVAMAVRICVPFDMPRVFHCPEYGGVVSAGGIFDPSILNWTVETATLSLAVAERVTVPEIVELFRGEVMETVGGVVSGGGGCTRVVTDFGEDCADEFPATSWADTV